MKILKNVLVLGLILVFVLSCKKDDIELVTIDVTQLPKDITELFVEKGNTSSDKVVLYSVGGPNSKLSTSYFDDLNFSEYHEVYVHQTNTYNDEVIIGLNENLSFERAIKEDEVSVEIFNNVVQHFKNQGKEVYVVGHSFGALLITSLIAKNNPNIEKYLIMAGRLKFPELVWQGFRDRKGYYFADGITPTSQDFSSSVPEMEKKEYYARFRLQAGFGKNNYLELLENKDLSNVIYAFGEKDEAVGSLTNEETNFLNTKNAVIYNVPDGSHGSMIDSPHKEKLKDLLFNQ